MTEVLDLRLPEMLTGSETEQLQKLRSYLISMAAQLEYAFTGLNRAQEEMRVRVEQAESAAPGDSFASIKALIIKSADIIEVMSQETERRLEGKYIAQSQFGNFVQETEQKITENSTQIRQQFVNLQEVESKIAGVEGGLLEVNASIRTGLLDEEDGIPVYGVEIGQRTEMDGTQIFRKFTRLTAEKLSFYDSNEIEVAYISDRKLYITEAAVQTLTTQYLHLDSLCLGEYTLRAGSNGHLTIC